MAVGNYYRVPEREVVVVRERALPPDEVPIVFYVAREAQVQPAIIVDLRRRGMSWADIAFHFQLTPDIYYFPGGPPYGKAHGYWKKHRPRDIEVVDAVNIHFLSEYHRVSPDAIRAGRLRGPSYAVVARNFDNRPNRGDDGRGRGRAEERGRSGERGNGKGRGRD